MNLFLKLFAFVNCYLFGVTIAYGQMTVTNYPQPPGYTFQQTRYKNDMCIDTLNNVWVGFRDIGVGRYDGVSWAIYDSLNSGVPSNNVLSVDIDAANQPWIGTMYGASHFNGVSWINYTTMNSGLVSNKVNSIFCEGNNAWMGTDEGVSVFDGSGWNNYNTSNSQLINDTVYCMAKDTAGGIWFGTARGVSRLFNNIWTSYDALNSILPSTKVKDLEADPFGNIWIVSSDLFRIDAAGQVLNTLDDLYFDELPLTSTANDLACDQSGNIYSLLLPNNRMFRFTNSHYELMQLPPFSSGAWATGYVWEIDGNNNLWMIFRVDYGLSSLMAFDLNSYQTPDPPLLASTIDNYRNLDINDVKALMLTGGDMHWDLSNSKYEVPKNSGKHTVYASAFWIGGMDATGQLHVAAQTYRQTGMDFWPGPIDGMSLPFDTSTCTHFNKIWKISKWEVEAFKTQYALGNVTNGSYAVPYYFLSWPAKGNNYITDDKAPFVDINNDGIYNPYDGDYPKIKGDQMLFWMFNDSLAPHSETGGPNLGVEVLASAYAYSCPGIADSNSVLNTTTLYHYKILNRSSTNYNNVYLGLWCDTDLGYNTDDYIGCDTTLAAGFTYNSDNNDGNWSGAYGLNPPMQNVVVLKGPLADIGDGLDNNLNGMIDEPGEHTTMNHFHTYWGTAIWENPHSDNDHYKYMTSFWLDSTHVTYGGWGGSSGTIPTNFIYSGTPYDTGWSETSIQSIPEDRKFLMSSGPVSLPAGDTLELDFAYVFTRDSLNPNGLTTSIARNKADVQRVHSWFDNDNFPSCIQYVTGDVSDFESSSWMFMVYPNPAIETIYLDVELSQPETKAQITIYNLAGQVIKRIWLNSDNLSIDIKDLPSGIFFIELNLSEKKMYGKFAKL